VLDDSEVTFRTDQGALIGEHLKLDNASEVSHHDRSWKQVYGERSTVRDHYRSLRIDLTDTVSGHSFQIKIRCYDSGIAYQVHLKPLKAGASLRVAEERSKFRFTGDHLAWCAPGAQDEYRRRPLSKIAGRVERPLTIEGKGGWFAAIAEAGLVDYATMQLQRDADDPHCVVSQLGGSVEAEGGLTTPWRVIMLGASPGELLENNYLTLNLSAPCAIADTSWIKPGKVIREVTLTTVGGKACVDFAVKNNFQYIEYDAGWYGHEYDELSDGRTVTPDPKRNSGELDLQEVIDYGSERGIGVILYVNRRVLERQLDEILPLYKKWGVAGVKYGFVNTGTQAWTSWLHEAVRKAANHELMVDIHDKYRPVGYSRTYPNLLTQEGVCGDEAPPSASTAVATLFTRNLAGAADHTICYFDPRVANNWTHTHQLAKAVCTYSPWQFIYWYDTPLPESKLSAGKSRIIETPELEFFARVPTVWDETRVLHGEIGEYAVIARRSGEDWFIGAMNGDTERELDVAYDFLPPNTKYKARTYSDDSTVERKTKVRIDERLVDCESGITLKLQPNGGHAAWITPQQGADALTVSQHVKTSDAGRSWRDLFNGKDLAGWQANSRPSSFSVVNGQLKVHGKSGMSHLFYVGETGDDVVFKDFELEAIARCEPGSNSGFFFHTDRVLRNNVYLFNGYEVQLNNSPEEKHKTGSLYAVVDVDQSPVDEKDWFGVRVRVEGKRIQIHVNDEQVVDYTEPASPARDSRFANRLISPVGGAIAIQAHDPKSVFYFKQVRIRELD
jgi:alpha-glucosidase